MPGARSARMVMAIVAVVVILALVLGAVATPALMGPN
jgi:hypothetical protein